MAQTPLEILQQAELYSDEQLYNFIKLPANAIMLAAGIVAETGMPFCAMLVDKDEVTLMLPSEAADQFSKRLRDAEISSTMYRLITFDIELDPTLIGFIATVGTVLAEAGVSIMPFAAYSRDHIFVPEDQFDRAIKTLEALKPTY